MGNPTKISILASLDELGITYDPSAKYEDLRKLLASSQPEERLSSSPKQEEPEERLQAPVHESVAVQADYLRQYQYRKQTEFGSVASDPQPGSKAEKMKALLLSQPKVGFTFPLVMGEAPNSKQSICINGYRLDFPKNAYIEVPMQIAQESMQSQGQTNAAIAQFQIRQDQEKALL